jgi:hypothetical protein
VEPCIEWTGPRSHGYGIIRRNKRNVRVHRLIVELADGPLLPGEVVRHACDNKACFRYSHLRRGTHADNMRDAVERGQLLGRRNWHSLKTHCPKGHPYDEENTRWKPRPGGRWSRVCRTCQRGYTT